MKDCQPAIQLYIFIHFPGSGEIIAPTQVYFGDSHAHNGCINGIVPVNDPKGKTTSYFP